MGKSCFDGYLTEACAKCCFWSNGDSDMSIGCCCPFPIMECDAFAKMFNEEEAKDKANCPPTSIKLSTLSRLLSMFNKQPGHKLDKILVYVDGFLHTLYEIKNDDFIVIIEDIRTIKTDDGRTITFYTSIFTDDIVPLNDTNGESVTVGQFLSLIIKVFENDRFRPHVNIRHINDDACETCRTVVEASLIENRNRIIRQASIDVGNNKQGYSCRILLKTY